MSRSSSNRGSERTSSRCHRRGVRGASGRKGESSRPGPTGERCELGEIEEPRRERVGWSRVVRLPRLAPCSTPSLAESFHGRDRIVRTAAATPAPHLFDDQVGPRRIAAARRAPRQQSAPQGGSRSFTWGTAATHLLRFCQCHTSRVPPSGYRRTPSPAGKCVSAWKDPGGGRRCTPVPGWSTFEPRRPISRGREGESVSRHPVNPNLSRAPAGNWSPRRPATRPRPHTAALCKELARRSVACLL